MKKWAVLLAVACIAGCAAPAPMALDGALGASAIRPAKVKVSFTKDRISTDFAEGDAGVAGRAVTIDDPARVASISKLVVALGVMRLVDEGKIDLDRDVSAYLGWQIRNPAFPDAPITMRQLLSHRAGLTDGIDYIMPLDGDLSLILANPKAWDDAHPPSSYFRYANINSPLIAATMEGATGERFDRLMDRLVLAPLKLDACYNWSAGCSAGRRAQAVTLLRPNGNLAKDAAITGTDPCPLQTASDGSCDIDKSYRLARNGSAFSPQGGLRISPRDLAKIGQVLLADGKPLLSPKAFAMMLGPVWTFDGTNGDDEKGYFKAYGLGIHWVDDGKGGQWIGHVGEAYSLRAGFWVNRKTGRGLVQYVTMVDEFAPVGHCFETCP
jgi:CubicO group peptidase (beta-lactamase class C family)